MATSNLSQEIKMYTFMALAANHFDQLKVNRKKDKWLCVNP